MIEIHPDGYVRSSRRELLDDDWDSVTAEIELTEDFAPEALDGLEAFSHAEILFQFDRVDDGKIVRDARYPRGNTNWPRTGIFAQRAKDRPNRLGSTIVALLSREGRRIRVKGLDAVDGPPVPD